MDARATRMGAETLGYTAPRRVAPAPNSVQEFWGQVPPGVKTILKVVVVAAVTYAALTFLLPGVAYVIGSAVAGIGASVVSAAQATLAFFGISTAAAGFGAAAATETVTLGAGAAATALGVGTASIAPAAKAATVTTAAVTPSILPDLSSASTMDPSTALAQKTALASKAAVANTASLADLPDLNADHLATHNNHLHTDNAKIASKLGQEAMEIRDHASRHAPSTRDHISQIENKVAQWSDRVGGSQARSAQATHAETLHKRDGSFSTELSDERVHAAEATHTHSV